MGLVTSGRLGRFLSKLKDNFAKIAMERQPDMICTAESSDGVNYTVTIPGVTSLYSGLRIYVKFGRASASMTPKLNVNSLGAKNIRQPLTMNNTATAPGSTTTWLTTACPVVLTYTGSMWKVDFIRPSATDLYGIVPIASGGTGATTAASALTNLGAASQEYVDAQIASILERIEALES